MRGVGELDDEQFALLTRQFLKFLKTKNFKGKNVGSGANQSKPEKFNVDKTLKFANQQDTKKCYKC